MQKPNGFYRLHHFVTLTVNVMFFNGVTFMTTLSIKLRVINTKTSLLVKLIKYVVRLKKNNYARVGCMVNVILLDQEFERLRIT